jgi:hypothetical protein
MISHRIGAKATELRTIIVRMTARHILQGIENKYIYCFRKLGMLSAKTPSALNSPHPTPPIFFRRMK